MTVTITDQSDDERYALTTGGDCWFRYQPYNPTTILPADSSTPIPAFISGKISPEMK